MLPGDGTGGDIVEGLHHLGKRDALGTIHVDIFKLPHHGSMRNVSEELFRRVTADLYVISASKNHPDFETLAWIVEGAKRKNRAIRFLATNETKSTQQLMQTYDPSAFGYAMTFMKAGQHCATV